MMPLNSDYHTVIISCSFNAPPCKHEQQELVVPPLENGTPGAPLEARQRQGPRLEFTLMRINNDRSYLI